MRLRSGAFARGEGGVVLPRAFGVPSGAGDGDVVDGDGGCVSAGCVAGGVEVGELGVGEVVGVDSERGGVVGVEAFDEILGDEDASGRRRRLRAVRPR